MGFKSLFTQVASSCKKIFNTTPEYFITSVEATGEKTKVLSADVFNEGRYLAHIDKFQQPCHITKNGNAVVSTIHERVYKPTKNTKLADMGIMRVIRTETSEGANIGALVNTIQGPRYLNSTDKVKDYVKTARLYASDVTRPAAYGIKV